MALFKKLFGLGIAAGTGAAVVKIAEKVKAGNPEGFTGPDGKTDTKAAVEEITKAAGELYHEAARTVKEKAPAVADKIKSAVSSLGNFSADADFEIIPEDDEQSTGDGSPDP